MKDDDDDVCDIIIMAITLHVLETIQNLFMMMIMTMGLRDVMILMMMVIMKQAARYLER